MKERSPPGQGGPNGIAKNDEVLASSLLQTLGPNSSENAQDVVIGALAVGARALADRVVAGELSAIDAIDQAYDRAVALGLPESVGDDTVQNVLANVFAPVRRRG